MSYNRCEEILEPILKAQLSMMDKLSGPPSKPDAKQTDFISKLTHPEIKTVHRKTGEVHQQRYNVKPQEPNRVKEILRPLAQESDVSRVESIDAAAHYYRKHGYDPTDLSKMPSHVSKEIGENEPSFAHQYTAFSIVAISRTFYVVASLLHALPSCIFARDFSTNSLAMCSHAGR